MPHQDQCVVVVSVKATGDIDNTIHQNKADQTTDNKDAENKTISGDDGVGDRTTFYGRFGGMLMALCASMVFSVTFLIIKILGNHGFHAFGAAVLLNVGILLPCFLVILYHEKGPGAKGRPRIFKEIWPLNIPDRRKTFIILVVQGTLQGLSIILRSCSIRYISIGDMAVIVFSSPVVTTFIAHFLVGEKCGLFFIFTAILTLGGVGLITKPPFLTGATSFDQNAAIGSGLAVGAMLSLSMKFALTRKIKDTHCLLMSVFLGGCGFLLSLPLFLIFEDWSTIQPTNLQDSLLVSGLITAFFSVVCINMALKHEDAGPVALIRSCDVIFAFLLQYIFLGVVPDILSTIGAIVVVSGVLLTGLRKWLMLRVTETRLQQPKEPKTCCFR